MAKGIYTGVDNKARKVKKVYIGVDNVARKVKKVYIGDSSGKARLAWSAGWKNILPTAVATDGTTIFNGTGYMNGAYLSTPHYYTDAECVCTGFMLIEEQVNEIYVKGATWNTAKSHVRFRLIHKSNIGTNNYAQTINADGSGATQTSAVFSSVETLGTDYYRFTFKNPSAWVGYAFLFSLIGTGQNLKISLDNEIDGEESTD